MDVVAAASRCPLMGLSASVIWIRLFDMILIFVYPSLWLMQFYLPYP